VDRDTIDLYEQAADEWVARRSPSHMAAAEAFASRVPDGGGAVADLGCGPGWYAPALPAPVVALDATRAMLVHAASKAPGALRVQADLEALPFRAGALRGGWARNSYVHLRRDAVPLALADLHRSLRVGAPVTLGFFGSRDDTECEGSGLFPSTDFPDRFFSVWSRDHLHATATGAGFEVDVVEHRNDRGERAFDVVGVRARTLPDTVGPGMRLLVCGLNPSLTAADAGVGFAGPTNRFWRAAVAARLVSRERDARHALLTHRIGMTDLVKRATVGAKEVRRAEYSTGIERVERLVRWLQPGAVCFVGLAGWRAAVNPTAGPGPQEGGFGGVPAYVMPSTSGLNARTPVAELVEHLRASATMAGP
jgi:TDG/mug DNA glycosylase family protein